MLLTNAFGNNDMITQAFTILMLLRTTFTLFYIDSPLARDGKGGGLLRVHKISMKIDKNKHA